MSGLHRAPRSPFSQPPAWTPLQQIRYGWGDAYEIEMGRARRRDGLGGWLEADDSEDLQKLISNDYTALPVPRQTVR